MYIIIISFWHFLALFTTIGPGLCKPV